MSDARNLPRHVASRYVQPLREGEEITVESILGAQSVFAGRIAERGQVGPYAAVRPEVSGTAFITGRHEFILDPRDTLGAGFLLG